MPRPTRQPQPDTPADQGLDAMVGLAAGLPRLPDATPYPHPQWFEWLGPELTKPYFKQLLDRLRAADRAGEVYPPPRDRYAALRLPPADVRVVVLGQDPYHGPGQAHGLAFSVRPGVKIPPSLANVYREIEREGLGVAAGRDGCLTPWTQQGVLLLNNVLTVAAGAPGSHRGWGWERFTDAIVSSLNARREGLVFLLWGRDAATKADRVDRARHLVLTSPHPSPYSANSGFFGNDHFRRANEWLAKRGEAPIRW